MKEFQLSQKALRTRPQAIGYLMQQGVGQDVISLAAGLVDRDTLPSDTLLEHMDEFLCQRGKKALQYGTCEGLPGLREKVLSRLQAADGVPAGSVGIDRVMISTGSQQMLYILTEALVDPGDIVITAAPTYFVYLGTLETMGATVIGIPSDRDGMIVEALDEKLAELARAGDGGRVKIVYITSYFDNPAGRSLSVERRRRLVEVVKSYEPSRPLIIEDAAYRELRYGVGDTPSVWSFDDNRDSTAYIGTFSKPFSPGLRTGFAVLPEALVEKVTLIKSSHDFGSPNFGQCLLDFAMEKGVYDSHVEVLRRRYSEKCALMCKCLDENLSGAASWEEPLGGLYVWIDFPKVDTGMDGGFFRACHDAGVLYVPGGLCLGAQSSARLCFAPVPDADIVEGVSRLASALAAYGAKV